MQSFPDTVFNVTHFADVGPLWIQGASLSYDLNETRLEILSRPKAHKILQELLSDS